MEQKIDWTLPENALPNVGRKTTLYAIYKELAKGSILTALDGIIRFRTMHFAKYISILQNNYNIPVQTRWIQLDSGKYCKQYRLRKNQ